MPEDTGEKLPKTEEEKIAEIRALAEQGITIEVDSNGLVRIIIDPKKGTETHQKSLQAEEALRDARGR